MSAINCFRTILAAVTVLGALAKTTHAASPPQSIVGIGPLDLYSSMYNVGYPNNSVFKSFSIATAGAYIVHFGLINFEQLPNSSGYLEFKINNYYTIQYFLWQSLVPRSDEVFFGVGDYVLSITAVGVNYKAIGATASVTPLNPVTPVPGPIAGAGLPILLGFAGYAAWRLRAAKSAA